MNYVLVKVTVSLRYILSKNIVFGLNAKNVEFCKWGKLQSETTLYSETTSIILLMSFNGLRGSSQNPFLRFLNFTTFLFTFNRCCVRKKNRR